MKYIGFLFFLLVISVIAWPYAGLYQLSEALANNDQAALAKLVDLDAVRTNYKHSLDSKVKSTVGSSDDPLTNMVREGARMLGGTAVDISVDMTWVKNALQGDRAGTLMNMMSFAFFESPTRFLVRNGELGQNPVHFYMTLHDWNWRLSAVYN